MEEAHLPKRTLPDHLDRLKVVDAKSTSFQSAKETVFSLRKKEFSVWERKSWESEPSWKKSFSQPEEFGFFSCMLTPLLCSNLKTFNISFGFHNLGGDLFLHLMLLRIKLIRYHIFGKDLGVGFVFHKAKRVIMYFYILCASATLIRAWFWLIPLHLFWKVVFNQISLSFY